MTKLFESPTETERQAPETSVKLISIDDARRIALRMGILPNGTYIHSGGIEQYDEAIAALLKDDTFIEMLEKPVSIEMRSGLKAYFSDTNHSPLTNSGTLHALEEHSFSDEASRLVLGRHPQLKMQHDQSIEDVWRGITEQGNLGMIPFENSSGGVVWPNLDRLLYDDTPLKIAASVRLQIRMCAGGKKGTNLQNVTHVYSHPKGLDQASQFLGQLPNTLRKIECESTVDGVNRVAQSDKASHVALASRSAIEAMGLEVVAEDIANLRGAQNVTKFFVIGKNGHGQLPNNGMKHHALIITPHNHTGVLATILTQISMCRMDLVSIHSRSIANGKYSFFLEMERRGTNDEMGVLDQFLKVNTMIESARWLGSWDEEFVNSTKS